MIIELHALQTFAPSNLNRDDTGNPKEALFGGARRARVSSQSAKRAMRVSEIFQRAVEVPIGVRTKILRDQLVTRMVGAGWDEPTAVQDAEMAISELYAKADKKSTDKSSVLLYITEEEIQAMIDHLAEARQQGRAPEAKAFKNKFIKQFENRTSAPDIALFGRMLAENPALNLDAACQVAHAISTHEVHTAEFDYFTAVDDLQPEDTTGAGMIGLVAFNSATYYRCARIDWEQLVKNLDGNGDLAAQTVTGFMRAFALVVPSGMKNSFVNQHAPDFLLAALRPDNDGQSLANAFEKPVRAQRGSGYAEPSIAALATYWDQVEGTFRLSDPLIAVLNPRGVELSSAELAGAVQPNLAGWIDTIISGLA